MDTLVSVLLFILIFCIVVVSHEFGHFLLAKVNGIGVKEFMIGMGPKIFAHQGKKTLFTIRLIPIGGACVFEGDEDELPDRAPKSIKEVIDSSSSDADKDESEEVLDEAVEEGEKNGIPYPEAGVWARISVVFAGPLFNIILGFIVSLIMVNLIIIRNPVASEVAPDSPAALAGMIDGDEIKKLGGKNIYLFDDIFLFTFSHKGGECEVVYERDGKEYKTMINPVYSEETGRYMLGITNNEYLTVKGLPSIKYAYYEMRYYFRSTFMSLKMLVGGQVKREDVAGPVGIAVNVVGETYENTKEYGAGTVFVNMLNIVLMLTVNLGILNLLPIPAIDGGKLIFLFIEAIRGKPVPRDKEGIVHIIGIVILLGLMVFVFFNDLINIFG